LTRALPLTTWAKIAESTENKVYKDLPNAEGPGAFYASVLFHAVVVRSVVGHDHLEVGLTTDLLESSQPLAWLLELEEILQVYCSLCALLQLPSDINSTRFMPLL